MTKVTTIAIKPDTKEYYDQHRGGLKHDSFLRNLVLLWDALTPAERHRFMARKLEQHPPATQQGG